MLGYYYRTGTKGISYPERGDQQQATCEATAASALRRAQAQLASPTDTFSLEEGKASIFTRPGHHESGLPSYTSMDLAENGGFHNCQFVTGEIKQVKPLFLLPDGRQSRKSLLALTTSTSSLIQAE